MLVEEKLKKVTTEKAPVAGGSVTGGSATGRSFQERRDQFAQLLQEAGAGNGRNMNLGHLQDVIARGVTGSQQSTPNAGRNEPGTGSGAAAAAGVLTAVDEDQEGDEEASVPDAFDYHTDAEEDE